MFADFSSQCAYRSCLDMLRVLILFLCKHLSVFLSFILFLFCLHCFTANKRVHAVHSLIYLQQVQCSRTRSSWRTNRFWPCDVRTRRRRWPPKRPRTKPTWPWRHFRWTWTGVGGRCRRLSVVVGDDVGASWLSRTGSTTGCAAARRRLPSRTSAAARCPVSAKPRSWTRSRSAAESHSAINLHSPRHAHNRYSSDCWT